MKADGHARRARWRSGWRARYWLASSLCRAPERGDDVARRLHQLDQHALGPDRRLLIAARMDEADVVARGTLANPAGSEADAIRLEPLNSCREIVDPEADVIERWLVHARLSVRIDRL